MMEKYGVYCIAIVLLSATASFGRPTEDPKMKEIRIARLEIKLLQNVRPCYARLLEVRTDIKEFNDIRGDPHYVPECDKEGIKWRSAQCDHHDNGTCFCVHEENGEVQEHTRNYRLNKEALKCGRRTAFDEHTDHLCFHMKDEFTHMQEEYGLKGLSPLPYYPDCTKNGKFMALQRNEMSEFFCVDTETGDIIPDTKTAADKMPPLNEYICQAYDEVWQDFKKWNASQETSMTKEVTKESCNEGFIFSECGCPLTCTSNSKANDSAQDCVCKPACLCPKGKWELDGACLSLEECHEAVPKSNVLFAQQLEVLTAGKFSIWQQYLLDNPNIVLDKYNVLASPSEEEYAGGPIAFDVDPYARSFFNEGPPSEHTKGNPELQNESEGENETSEANPEDVGYRGGEPIPGGSKPNLLIVLQEPETDIDIETGTRPVSTSQTSEGEEPADRDEATTEFHPSVESYGSEQESREPSENESSEEEGKSYVWKVPFIYESNDTADEYYYYEEPGTSENVESTSVVEAETTEEEEEEEEETNENEWYEEVENTVSATQSTTEPKEYMSWLPENIETDESSSNEETENTAGVTPEEENEESNDQGYGHQKSVTSVQSPSNDEQREHSSTPPCEEIENLDETNTESSVEEEALNLINRVLTENKVVVAFEKESPSVKKTIYGK